VTRTVVNSCRVNSFLISNEFEDLLMSHMLLVHVEYRNINVGGGYNQWRSHEFV